MCQIGKFLSLIVLLLLPGTAYGGFLFSPTVQLQNLADDSIEILATSPPSSRPPQNLDSVSALDYGITSGFITHLSMEPMDLIFEITNPAEDSSNSYTRHRITGLSANATGLEWVGYQLELGWMDADGEFHLADASTPDLEFDPFDIFNFIHYILTNEKRLYYINYIE